MAGNSRRRPTDIDVKASVFKVPHHGSENAQVDRVWCEMLQERPIAVLTPWRKRWPVATDRERYPEYPPVYRRGVYYGAASPG